MATVSISQMTTAATVDNGDLFEVAHPDSGSASGYSSNKQSLAAIADHIASTVNYPALTTTAKTLIGAINEAAQSGGGGTHDFSSNWQIVGKWVDGKDIYEKTYVFSVSDMQTATISASVMKGQFLLDQISYDSIWIDYGNSFLMNRNYQTSPVKSHPLNFVNPISPIQFTRTSVQRLDEVNSGYPFIYFENNVQAASWYDIRTDLRFYFTIRYTMAS